MVAMPCRPKRWAEAPDQQATEKLDCVAGSGTLHAQLAFAHIVTTELLDTSLTKPLNHFIQLSGIKIGNDPVIHAGL